MPLPFTRDAFFDVFAAYNASLSPFAVALWLLTAAVFAELLLGGKRPRLMASVLALNWAWVALAYHAAFFARINPAAWVFSGLFLVEAALLVWHGVIRGNLLFSPGRSIRCVLAWALIAYALLYPALVQWEGHAFPRVPTFGVPCPTTILTIGFLIGVDRSRSSAIAFIPIVWALIGGSAAFLFGVRADLMLLAAGFILAIDSIASWHSANAALLTRNPAPSTTRTRR